MRGRLPDADESDEELPVCELELLLAGELAFLCTAEVGWRQGAPARRHYLFTTSEEAK